MSTYAYIPGSAKEENKIAIERYCVERSMSLKQFISDTTADVAVFSQKRRLNESLLNILSQKFQVGDTLISYDAASLGGSILDILEVFKHLSKQGVSLHLVKYKRSFKPAELVDTLLFLEIIKSIEQEFAAKRTEEGVQKRRDAGSKLGRPQGRRNKSRKLDVHLEEIRRYMQLKISKTSIAKLIGCHAQTLYNYIGQNPELFSDIPDACEPFTETTEDQNS